MAVRTFLAIAVLVVFLSPLALLESQERLLLSPLALTHVTVIDGTGAAPRTDVTVLIVGDRIRAIGASRQVSVPRDAEVLNLSGRFLIPGLWNMHVHSVGYAEGKKAFPRLLASGVTGLRDMGAPLEDVLRLRHEANAVTGAPRMIVAGPLLVRPLPPKLAAMTLVKPVNSPEDGAHAVRVLKGAGVDFIKVDGSLPRETYFAVAAEATRQRIAFVGHIPPWIGASEASEAGQRSVEHLGGPHHAVLIACSTHEADLQAEATAIAKRQIDAVVQGAEPEPGELSAALTSRILDSYSETKATTLFHRFRRNGTWQVPTLVAIRGLWDRQGLTTEDVTYGERIKRKQLDVVAAMWRAGVKVLAGTDGPLSDAGAALHEELTLLVKAGLTPIGALQAATIRPAEFMGKLTELGTIEEGKMADLVMLDADPLADITNTRRVVGVILHGKLATGTALAQMGEHPAR